MRTRVTGWLVLCLCSWLVACSPYCSQSSLSILFIGNSLTYYNDGLGEQLAGLAPSACTGQIAEPGYTLENHWTEGKAVQSIQHGGWDFVVLQEQGVRPVLSPEKFFEFAADFDAEIRKSGAQTVLLMTWERPESLSAGVTTASLAAAYNLEAARLGDRVAPAGLAFARSLQQRPDLALYIQDGHPTSYGTYLAACVLYGTILNLSPVGNAYAPAGITPEQRDFFQRVAAEILGFKNPN